MSSLTSPSMTLEPLIPSEERKDQKVQMEKLEIEHPSSNYTSITVNKYEKFFPFETSQYLIEFISAKEEQT